MRAFTLFVFLFAVTGLTVYGQGSPTWQQQVAYEMDITVHTDRHQLDGFQRLTYTNNSPDTLRQVFYHLYFNAFHPNSMMAERNRHLPDPDGRTTPRIWNLGPDEVGYHNVQQLTQDGRPVAYELNDTVLRVDLADPILPGETTVFEMVFDSQVPLQTRRSGRDNREGIDYSMSQWYPKMANYDERGWHADPYVGREFYAPFGTFDVRLTLPTEYIVGSTGVLQNAEAIGYNYQADTTRAVDHSGADSLTWHFVAENVHDFAWAADPDYQHDQIVDEELGVTYHLLYQPDVAASWQPMKEWVPSIIRFFSEQYGLYPYPQFTVAQAGDGGMEYPMMNFITGRRSPMSLLGVTAHEAAHEWFYGAIGTNEADYAWMDEGFTSYATTEAVAHVLGRPDPSHAGALRNVMTSQYLGFAEPFNTPSDWFERNAAYGIASYSGGQAIASMLGYVISDSLRDAFFKEYFRRFRFGHPNPYDVEKVAEDVSGLRLDWFFQQLLTTTESLDYEVDDLESTREGDAWRTTLEIEREDDLVMPADVRLTYADGTTQWVTIPLGLMQGHKPVPEDWIVAEPWLWTFPEYELELTLPKQVVEAEFDPLFRTIDIDRLNNSTSFPMQARFLQPAQPSWEHYSVGYRPLAQYADQFGFGVGLQARGAYQFGQHTVRAMVKLWPEVLFSDGDDPDLTAVFGTGAPDVSFFDGIDYELSYTDHLPAFGTFAQGGLTARKHLGVMETRLDFSKPLGDPIFGSTSRTFQVAVKHQYVPTDRAFALFGTPWFLGDNLLSAQLSYRVSEGGSFVEVGLEAGASIDRLENRVLRQQPFAFVSNRQQATHAYLAAQKSHAFGRFTGQARLFAGLGSEALALQKRFRLGTATAEQTWRNDAARTGTAVFENALEDAHFTTFSGVGPIAYLYDGVEGSPSRVGGTPTGTSMLAGSVELTTGPLKPRHNWLRALSLELFSGVGTVWGTNSLSPDPRDRGFDAENLIADAGIGATVNVGALRALNRWVQQSDVLSTMQLTVKLPVWASDPGLIESGSDAFDLRWLVGISTGL